MCRVRNCAGRTTRQRIAPRTIALPGTPREPDLGSRSRAWPTMAKPRLAYGRPLVRSGRGGQRPLASAIRDGSSGSEGGRRRTSSVVADLPATSARPRCSCDAGTPGGVPEGRGPGHEPYPMRETHQLQRAAPRGSAVLASNGRAVHSIVRFGSLVGPRASESTWPPWRAGRPPPQWRSLPNNSVRGTLGERDEETRFRGAPQGGRYARTMRLDVRRRNVGYFRPSERGPG